MNNTDLENLKKQLLNVQKYIKEMDEINPDDQMYLQGRDIYIIHVDHVVDEVLGLIQNIEDGKSPTYTDQWVKKEIKNKKEEYGE